MMLLGLDEQEKQVTITKTIAAAFSSGKQKVSPFMLIF